MLSQGVSKAMIKFAPTILEHAAKLINKTPSEVAQDEMLMCEAHVKAFEIYEHDIVNVGIDVYNIEAEALGCKVKYHEDNSIPGISTHIFSEFIDIETIEFSVNKGRIKTLLNAASMVREKIDKLSNVNIGICGPFSIAVELRGYENVINDYINEKKEFVDILDACLMFQKRYCDEIAKRELGITVFESWATPPLVTPDMYRKYIMPYERELISYMKKIGIFSAPLIIGGNTELIIDDMISTGTTLLLADYCVDLGMYVEKASMYDLTLRGNIDPKIVEKGPIDVIIEKLHKLLIEKGEYMRFIVGTGVLSYNTPTENILAIKNILLEATNV